MRIFHAREMTLQWYEQRIQCLILGAGRDIACYGQMGQEIANFSNPHLSGVTFTMEDEKSPDPANIGLFGPDAIMPNPDGGDHFIQKGR